MIRLTTAADVNAVRACIDAAYAEYVPLIGGPPAPMLDDYVRRVANGETEVFVADGTVVGVLVTEVHPASDEIHIATIATRPDLQGQGIGTQLLRHAESKGQQLGFRWARLYTNEVMASNLTWYPRAGYTEYDRRSEDGFNRVYFERLLADVGVRDVRAHEWRRLKAFRLRALSEDPGAFSTTFDEANVRTDESWQTQAAGLSPRTGQPSCTFVAVGGDDRWLGMVGSYRPEPDDDHRPAAELVAMWTAPEGRRRGVGRALIDAVVREADPLPVGLWVRTDNSPAIALYEASGFVIDTHYVVRPGDP